jgi:chaperone modulatory protein CbpM
MQDEHLIPVQELCSHHNIEQGFMQLLQDYGLVELTMVEQQVCISSFQLPELEKMIRLHHDLNVNIEGIDVIRHLLKKLEEAQDEIGRLKCRLRFYGEPG